MKELSEFTDTALIQLYRAESNTEFIGELYKRYSLLVFGLCYKYLRNEENAKDATSDIVTEQIVHCMKHLRRK